MAPRPKKLIQVKEPKIPKEKKERPVKSNTPVTTEPTSSSSAAASATVGVDSVSDLLSTLTVTASDQQSSPSTTPTQPQLNAKKKISPIDTLDTDTLSLCLSFLPSRDLGASLIASRQITALLSTLRTMHVIDRCKLTLPPSSIDHEDVRAANVMIERACFSGVQVSKKQVVSQSSKRAKATNNCIQNMGYEFPSYARFLEEALHGYAVLRCGGNADDSRLPAIVAGRFASCSPEHSIIRSGGGGSKGGGSGVVTWGVGARGQLGHGNREDHETPFPLAGGIGYNVRVIQVAAGGGLVRVAHTLLLTDTGRVLSFGNASYGQLGHGYGPGKTLPDERRPKYIDSLCDTRVICVAAGELHSAAVSHDGDLYTWGEGFCGQLGLGDKSPQLKPTIVAHELEYENVLSVNCGARHTLCVTEDFEVFSFGLGFFGALGREFTPFEYANDNLTGVNVVLDEEREQNNNNNNNGNNNGNIAGADNNNADEVRPPPPPVPTPTLTTDPTGLPLIALMLTPGAFQSLDPQQQRDIHNLAKSNLTDNSTQCLPFKIDALDGIKIIAASAGHRHSMCVDDQGWVYTWGSGGGGALGHGDNIKRSVPERVDELVHLNKRAINMSAGVDISMIVTDEGDCYAWGRMKGGRIGLGMHTQEVTIPRKVQLGAGVKAAATECGYVHSLIVLLTGEVMVCGGVGTNNAEDGSFAGNDGLPRLLEEDFVNVWQRNEEVKEVKKKVEYKKYGEYKTMGRTAMMATGSTNFNSVKQSI